ncbi:hypothetical protein [Ensifer sesbaniae]|jgi:hypothetical protein|uniref:hypothetical protein n=2 Tax=Ensifer sesbaniae TaxID=1214071 RepID=UPI001FE89A28|nr:hypothetical protein [Ensifer sesbaniae]
MIDHAELDLSIHRELGKMMLSSFAVPVEPEDKEKELLALARLVTYARDSAKTLNVEGVQYCLELALASLLKEAGEYGDKRAHLTNELMTRPSLGRC